MARAKRKSKFRGKVAKNTQKQKTAGSKYGHLNLPRGVNIFKEEPGGRATLDFLPYVVEDEMHLDRDVADGIAVPGNPDTDLWYKKPYRIHRNMEVGKDEKEDIVCPTTWGKPCPICEYKAAKLKDGADYDDVKDLKPSLRNIYLVIPLGMKDYKEDVHIWDISQHLFQNKLNEELGESDDYCEFPDLENGLTVRIRFSEEKYMSHPYADTSRIDFEERANQYDEDMLNELPCLDHCVSCPTYEEVERLFLGVGDVPEPEPEPDKPEPEPDKPKTTGLIRRKKPAKTEPEPEKEPDENACVACGGEGVNSKGGVCKPCGGSGQKTSATDPKPPEITKPQRTRKSSAEKAPEKPETKPASRKRQERDECPYAYKFGVDTDTKEECDNCEKWDDCIEAKES